MGRPTGSKNKTTLPSPTEDLTPLTDSEIWDVLEFSKRLNNMYPGIFNPDLVNSRLKDINSNPLTGTSEQIAKALKDPKNHEDQLRGYSENFEYTSMSYKRILSYYSTLLSFNYTYTSNASASELKSPAYKKEVKIVEDFLDKFKVKREFPKVMHQLMREDAYFCVLRNEGEQYVLQELPIKYCQISGMFEYGYLFDYNMQYFTQAGVDINCYPDVFKEYWNRVMDNKNNGYSPSKTIDERTGEYVYWCQCSPNDGMWAWKLNPNQVTRVAPFSPLFLDLIDTETVRQLQQNRYVISAYRLLMGKIPRLEGNKNGQIRDSLAISPELAGSFAGLIKQGLPTQVGFGFSPFEQITEHTFATTNDDTNIYENQLKTTVSNSGAALQAVFSTDKANLEATRASLYADAQFVEYIYREFDAFMNFYVNQLTKKFKFDFKFEGVKIPFIENDNFDKVMQLAQNGMVLPQKISSAIGMEFKDFKRQLMEAKESGFEDLFMILPTAFTQSAKSDKKNGRPESSSSDLTESGADTRNNGSNIAKGGKV